MYFFYDTETTGLPLFRERSSHPDQPHICQLACLLTDNEGAKIAAMDTLITPDDSWNMSPEAEAVHGISIEMAKAGGVASADAMRIFARLWQRAEKRIGFNEQFDARLVRIALIRLGDGSEPSSLDDNWKAGAAHCVMQQAKPIVKMPPTEKMKAAGFNAFKPPKLTEAYKFFFDEELDGAHDAMIDVNATARIFFHLQGNNEEHQDGGIC